MIKPTYLWALCKTCDDSKWIGDICRSLGGQEVALDFGQRQVAEMIKMDSEWMDERINWNREAARMRQARARERRAAEKASREVTPVTRDNEASREVTPASRHPSVRPSCNDNNIQDTTRDIGKVSNKNKTQHIPPHPPKGGVPAAVDPFDEFWKAYPRECPRKVDKVKCRAKFALLMKRAEDPAAFVAELMAGLGRWKRSETWAKDGGAFIRSPLVWLNNESWRDEPKQDAAAGVDAAADAVDRAAARIAAELRKEGRMA